MKNLPRSLPHVGRLIAALLFATLLTACQTSKPPAFDNATAAKRTYAETIDLTGRLSVQYQKDDKDEAIHASFTWRQAGDISTVTILSPLGQILATIDVKPGNATLAQSGQPPRSAANVDTLAAQALGWPLPISGLRSWLQGFATDNGNKSFVATPSNSKITTSDGWQINYVSWQDGETAQPKRIDLERQTEQAGKVVIRIVLDTWQQS